MGQASPGRVEIGNVAASYSLADSPSHPGEGKSHGRARLPRGCPHKKPLFMVRLSPDDGKRAIELLDQHQASQIVRESHF
jgi:hypothetical protein